MTGTNIDQLPQLFGQFVASANSDWRDAIQFNWAAGTPNAGQPIDLTGIDFYVQVRNQAGVRGSNLMVDASTKNGQIINGGQLGTMRMAVPQSVMGKCAVGVPLVTDIVAVGIDSEGALATINLSPAPSSLTVNPGVTFVGT